MREREFDSCFYTDSLNYRAKSCLPGQLEPSFHYYQNFYKPQPKITVFNNRNNRTFYSNKNLNHIIVRNTLIGMKPHQEHNMRHKNYKT